MLCERYDKEDNKEDKETLDNGQEKRFIYSTMSWKLNPKGIFLSKNNIEEKIDG